MTPVIAAGVGGQLVDRVYRAWLVQNGAQLSERECWLRDALAVRSRPGAGAARPKRQPGPRNVPLHEPLEVASAPEPASAHGAEGRGLN